MIRQFIGNEREKRSFEMHAANRKMITPIRLQAYERITLFLERIAPDSLIRKLQHQGMKSKQLQSEMINLIRAEYEHNLSQQIFISAEAWEVVKSAKENTVKIINSAADNVKPEDPALELGKEILESIMEMDKAPNQVAIDFIKKEVKIFY
ncbi:MAG TPA: hypothetical protein DEA97_17955 [Bacteroidales bacterium]|nr:hypothetical protein [Bacteroidales bacterium]